MLALHFEKGFESGIYSDITVVILEKQYKLHKIALCASPYFDALLTRWNDNKENELTISLPQNSHITSEAVDIAVKSFYSTQVKGKKFFTRNLNSEGLSESNFVGVLYVVNYFQIQPVLDECIKFSMSVISAATIVDTFIFAKESVLHEFSDTCSF